MSIARRDWAASATQLNALADDANALTSMTFGTSAGVI
jgi:hypothetical protein